jgi:hypothetical protein
MSLMLMIKRLIQYLIVVITFVALTSFHSTILNAQGATITYCREDYVSSSGSTIRAVDHWSYVDPVTDIRDIYVVDTTLPGVQGGRSICRRLYLDGAANVAYLQTGDQRYLLTTSAFLSDPRTAELRSLHCMPAVTNLPLPVPIRQQYGPAISVQSMPIAISELPILVAPVETLLAPTYVGSIPQLHSQGVTLPLVPIEQARGFEFQIPVDWLIPAFDFSNWQISDVHAHQIVDYYVNQLAGWQLIEGSLLLPENGSTFRFALHDGNGNEMYFQVVLSVFYSTLQIRVTVPDAEWGGGGQPAGGGLVGSNLSPADKDDLINQFVTLASFSDSGYETYIQQDAINGDVFRYLEFLTDVSGSFEIRRNETVLQASSMCPLPTWAVNPP